MFGLLVRWVWDGGVGRLVGGVGSWRGGLLEGVGRGRYGGDVWRYWATMGRLGVVRYGVGLAEVVRRDWSRVGVVRSEWRGEGSGDVSRWAGEIAGLRRTANALECELRELRAENARMAAEVACISCMDRPRNVVYERCRHRVVCEVCDVALQQSFRDMCIYCRQNPGHRIRHW
mmetsp:Transcript_9048/g.18285  ORF Transcript_9048/g.18285 Transcript_9048/m.18285 type:complete len:174 (+) Transcript_9048:410-931(+)